MFGLRFVNIKLHNSLVLQRSFSEHKWCFYWTPGRRGEIQLGEGMKPFISSGKECVRAGVLSLLYHSEMLSVPHLSPHPCFPFFGCPFLVLSASRAMGIYWWRKRASLILLFWGSPGIDFLKNQKLCPNRGDTFFSWIRTSELTLSFKANGVDDSRQTKVCSRRKDNSRQTKQFE